MFSMRAIIENTISPDYVLCVIPRGGMTLLEFLNILKILGLFFENVNIFGNLDIFSTFRIIFPMPIISIINDINIFSFQEKRARCSNQCIILAHVLPVSFLVAKCKCKFNMKTSINAKKVSCSMSIAHILLVFIASLGK